MADDRYENYRGRHERDRDRDVYLDNRSGVGAPQGRGYRASQNYGRDRDDDDSRGYASYGRGRESRSFQPGDYGGDYGEGSYSSEGYGSRSYQAGRTQSDPYGDYGGQRMRGPDSRGPFHRFGGEDPAAFGPGFTSDVGGYGGGFGDYGATQARYGADRDREQAGRGRDHHRGFWDRAGDTVASWLGDDEARRRHEQDVRASHRGKGPKGYKRSDERIREDLSERLTDDLWLDASNIEVEVKEGEVTLTGTVNSRDDRRYAERIAESVSGASHVQNNLRVSEQGQNQGQNFSQNQPVGAAAHMAGVGQPQSSHPGTSADATGHNDVLDKQAQGRH